MALYKVNTGCREQEVCQLRWDWEVQAPERDTSLFILPNNHQFETKNSHERIVVLNSLPAGLLTSNEASIASSYSPTGRSPVQHAEFSMAQGEGSGRFTGRPGARSSALFRVPDYSE
ncbi:MAG: hypothetical protein WD795_06005 [Woeseia sp.]